MSGLTDIVYGAWAIQPQMLTEIQRIYESHATGNPIDLASVEAKLGRPLDNQHKAYDVYNGVAVIPVQGVMAKKMNMLSAISGGVSSQLVGRDLEQALDDPGVHSVILHVDGPGGAVDGTAELAEKIRAGRDKKRIVTLADGLMASAHYWAGSAASEIYATGKTTEVGSIGVVTAHRDISGAEEKRGVVTTEIYSGKYKRIASQHKPLSDEGRQHIQEHTDYLYSVFVDAVADHRGVDASQVLSDMADGRLFVGQQALDAGLIDGFSSLDALIEKLNSEQSSATHSAGSALNSPSASADGNHSNLKTGEQTMEITQAMIESDHPEIAQAFRDEGATAERERIQSVEAQAMPGHEALIDTLKFDGSTTGPEAAVQVLNAERDKRKQAGADLQSDAPKPLESGAIEALEEGDDDPVAALNPKQVAEQAQALVAQAKANGRTLSVSQAVAMVNKGEHA